MTQITLAQPVSHTMAFAAVLAALLAATAATAEAGGADVPAPAPGPAGRWEGEIELPRRPLVVLIDFTARQAALGMAPDVTFPLDGYSEDARMISFELRLGRETLRFRGTHQPDAVRGHATLDDVDGNRLMEGVFLLRPLAELPPVDSRDDAWRQDLDVALTRFLPYDRSFSAESRRAFQERIHRLHETVDTKTDAEITVELARAVALSGNAHTRLYLVRNRTAVSRLPIRVWSFRDGVWVVRTTEEHADLLGCRVERVGGQRIATALSSVRGIKPGNDSWQRYMASYMLTSPEILAGAGVTPSPERATLELNCGGRRVSRTLSPLPFEPGTAAVEAWWDLSPRSARSDATPRPALADDRVPLYLHNPDVHYWFEYMPDRRILYFHYSRSSSMPEGPSLQEFGETLLAAARQHDVAALVVDLRFNTGGNLNVGTPLMRELQSQFAGQRVYVITGRSTFSAGITHAAQWKEWGATIVGEPVGDDLDMWAEGGNVILPHSGLTVHYSNGFHGYSTRDYPARRPYFVDLNVDSLTPDLPVEPTWSDYIDGRDPAMARIERELTARPPARRNPK